MDKAFVLINCEPGKEPSILNQLHEMKGVIDAQGTFGIYDIVAISAVGTILHYNMGNVPIYLVLFLLIGSIPGVFLGVKLASKISPRKMIAAFSLIILVAAIFLINRGFGII